MDHYPSRHSGGWNLKSVREAKQYLAAHQDDGVRCPCCGQQCRVYIRKLNSGQAVFLIRLVKLYEQQRASYHLRDILASSARRGVLTSRDQSYLVHFQAIGSEARGLIRPNPTSEGFWYPTKDGISFVHDRVKVWSHIRLLNNKYLGVDGKSKQITIRDALGSKFDLDELLAE